MTLPTTWKQVWQGGDHTCEAGIGGMPPIPHTRSTQSVFFCGTWMLESMLIQSFCTVRSPHCHSSRSVVGRAILIPTVRRAWNTPGRHEARGTRHGKAERHDIVCRATTCPSHSSLCRAAGRSWSSAEYNPCPGVMDGVPSSRGYTGGTAQPSPCKLGTCSPSSQNKSPQRFTHVPQKTTADFGNQESRESSP